jgi:GntR family transcriptional regulator/MocR family aminotransferase
LELARKHRFAIVEDDYDHEVHYRGRPILPLASADRAGVVVYLGTLSKVLAPGVRVGYVVAPRAVLERMTALRRMVDRQGDPAVERAVAELLEDGVVQRHARRMRRVYHARRDALLEAMHDRLGERLVAPVPDGGMALWARAAPGVDIDAWSQRAARAGVLFPTARSFALDRKPRPFARLPYAPLDERELREAVARMASCADA